MIRRSALACAAVLLTACSTSGAPARSASSAGIGACRLSGAQVSGIVGFGVKNGVGTAGERDCLYAARDGSRPVVISVRHIPGGESKVVANLEKEFKDVAPMKGTPGAYAVPELSEVVMFVGPEQVIVICHKLDATRELQLAKAFTG